MLQVLMWLFFVLAALSLVLVAFLLREYLRKERQWSERLQQTKADIAEVTVVFQTMRDIITQQKTMAREFNQDIEKKMALVRQVLSQGMEKNERLYEKQQQIAQELGEAQEQLSSLQRQLAYTGEASAEPAPDHEPPPRQRGNRAAPPRRGTRASETEQPTAPAPPQPTRSSRDADDIPFYEDEERAADAPYDTWSEVEAGAAYTEARPSPPPRAPEDAGAAREAFRALLDLEELDEDAAPPSARPPAAHAPAASPTRNPAPTGRARAGAHARSEARSEARHEAEGANGLSQAVHRRIVEYSEAGMSVGDIARELGLGKGEVRLVLSLARQRRS